MKEETKNSTWKFWVGLGAGIAAGVTAGLFLNSDEGRVWRKRTNKKVNKWGRKVAKNVQKEMDGFTTKATDLVGKTKDYTEKAKTTFKEKVENFSPS